MKLKNIGRRTLYVKGVEISVGEEKEVDVTKNEFENLPIKHKLVIVKEGKKKE